MHNTHSRRALSRHTPAWSPLRLLVKRTLTTIAFVGCALTSAGELQPVIVDQPVPKTEGGSLTVHVEAGREERDFHVTFEREGAYYAYFDGEAWTARVLITKGRPFRSGVHLAIDADNVAHAAWVEGGGDRKGTVKYRWIRNGEPGPVENVHAPQGWNECDIAVDRSGRVVIAANTTTQSEMAVYERQAAGGWKQTVLPSDNTLHKWSPSLVFAEDDLLFVAMRRKDAHPFTWQVRDKGVWTKDAATPWRSYEPNAIAHGRGIIATSMDGYVYRVEKRSDTFVTSHHDVRTMQRGVIRGQHVGIGRTTSGTLVLGHSDMKQPDQRDRTIGPGHRFYLSWSSEGGTTWTYNQTVAPEAGQGHGNLAVNRDWIMAVWPDIRGGPHIRYALWRDETPTKSRPADRATTL